MDTVSNVETMPIILMQLWGALRRADYASAKNGQTRQQP